MMKKVLNHKITQITLRGIAAVIIYNGIAEIAFEATVFDLDFNKLSNEKKLILFFMLSIYSYLNCLLILFTCRIADRLFCSIASKIKKDTDWAQYNFADKIIKWLFVIENGSLRRQIIIHSESIEWIFS